ncbi:hypothetical protein [Algicola sagamiensis]|uniref:hypothetical protein n=1 Tax=Algicola sagamiensis TaxID=163869 RepID=UPI0012FA3DDD|nr:hypothetical protein [Algicola sagamiensis]
MFSKEGGKFHWIKVDSTEQIDSITGGHIPFIGVKEANHYHLSVYIHMESTHENGNTTEIKDGLFIGIHKDEFYPSIHTFISSDPILHLKEPFPKGLSCVYVASSSDLAIQECLYVSQIPSVNKKVLLIPFSIEANQIAVYIGPNTPHELSSSINQHLKQNSGQFIVF